MSQRCSLLSILRSSRLSLIAAACLMAGWLHVWLHHAESGDTGHFEAEVAADCGLADTPPALSCGTPWRAWRTGHTDLTARTSDLAPRGRPIGIASIRAPPTA